MTKNSKKRLAFLRSSVYDNKDLMFRTMDVLWACPESGFREWETQNYLAEQYRALGYELTMFGNIPGFYCEIDTGRPGPKLLFMGEMDALVLPSHPECDPETGAVHACGHHAQSAALLGLAAALKAPGVLGGLCGSIRLMAVPGEELIELDFRKQLREQGVIRYLSGKTELLYRGHMDGCDMGVLVHTYTMPRPGLRLVSGGNGFIVKNVRYTGRAAHAGSFPDKGVNALYAANLGMQTVNDLRETFRDQDHVRFHPIVTQGGSSVSSIPSDVRVESYLRAASSEALDTCNRKINRALACTAAAMGAQIEIEDQAGYSPLHNDRMLKKFAADAICESIGGEYLEDTEFWSGGSTDLGDLSAIMPVLQPYCSGSGGTAHSENYHIADPESAAVLSAYFQLSLIDRLLRDDAAAAKEVVRKKSPPFASKDAFFHFLDTISTVHTPIREKGSDAIEICWD